MSFESARVDTRILDHVLRDVFDKVAGRVEKCRRVIRDHAVSRVAGDIPFSDTYGQTERVDESRATPSDPGRGKGELKGVP